MRAAVRRRHDSSASSAAPIASRTAPTSAGVVPRPANEPSTRRSRPSAGAAGASNATSQRSVAAMSAGDARRTREREQRFGHIASTLELTRRRSGERRHRRRRRLGPARARAHHLEIHRHAVERAFSSCAVRRRSTRCEHLAATSGVDVAGATTSHQVAQVRVVRRGGHAQPRCVGSADGCAGAFTNFVDDVRRVADRELVEQEARTSRRTPSRASPSRPSGRSQSCCLNGPSAFFRVL